MKLLDLLGKIPTYLELLGFRYPVKPYQQKVSETLWRGSRLDPAGIADLAKRGFRLIIDLTKEGTGDTEAALRAGMFATRVPILDDSSPTLTQMDQFLSFVTVPAYLPCYVHCEAGIGRTGIAVACYRMAVEHWSVDQAIQEARDIAKKHGGFLLPNQIEFLKRFAQRGQRGSA